MFTIFLNYLLTILTLKTVIGIILTGFGLKLICDDLNKSCTSVQSEIESNSQTNNQKASEDEAIRKSERKVNNSNEVTVGTIKTSQSPVRLKCPTPDGGFCLSTKIKNFCEYMYWVKIHYPRNFKFKRKELKSLCNPFLKENKNLIFSIKPLCKSNFTNEKYPTSSEIAVRAEPVIEFIPKEEKLETFDFIHTTEGYNLNSNSPAIEQDNLLNKLSMSNFYAKILEFFENLLRIINLERVTYALLITILLLIVGTIIKHLIRVVKKILRPSYLMHLRVVKSIITHVPDNDFYDTDLNDTQNNDYDNFTTCDELDDRYDTDSFITSADLSTDESEIELENDNRNDNDSFITTADLSTDENVIELENDNWNGNDSFLTADQSTDERVIDQDSIDQPDFQMAEQPNDTLLLNYEIDEQALIDMELSDISPFTDPMESYYKFAERITNKVRSIVGKDAVQSSHHKNTIWNTFFNAIPKSISDIGRTTKAKPWVDARSNRDVLKMADLMDNLVVDVSNVVAFDDHKKMIMLCKNDHKTFKNEITIDRKSVV